MYQEETDNTHAAYLKETEKEKQIMETSYQINWETEEINGISTERDRSKI